MKLLIITQKIDTNDDVLGFFENWVRHLAHEFNEVKVIALAKGEYHLPNNVQVVSLGKEQGRNKLFQAIIFYRYVLQFLPWCDGVFVHMAPEYVRVLYPVNVFLRKPICMWYAHIHVSGVARWALDRVARVFSPSKESFTFQSEKIIATGHGIDVSLFKPLDNKKQNPPVIMTMSRLSKVKRLHIFIEALHILHAKYPDVSFKARIVGGPARKEDGEYEASLQQLASTYGLENHIEWYGPVKNKDTFHLYNEASLFVRMQGGGGFGKTELESMACGTPVILCTDVYNAQLGEFAHDVYFPEDDAALCAEHMKSVLGWSEEKRNEYAHLSRGIVSNGHNLEHLAKRIAKEFRVIQGTK